MDETKIIYYVDDEETPYLIKFHTSPDQITLGDFKSALNKSNYKFFFKSLDDDFGVVKEEITDDDCKLPCVNGKVVSWLVVAEGSTQSDNHSSSGKEIIIGNTDGVGGDNNKGTISDSSDPKSPVIRASSRQQNTLKLQKQKDENKKHKSKYKFTGPEKISMDETDDAFDEIDSIYNADKVPPLRKFSDYKLTAKLKKMRAAAQAGNASVISGSSTYSNNGGNSAYSMKSGSGQQPIYESSSSMMSSDIDTTSFFDSEDDSSRFSSATETTMSSKYGRQKRQLRRRRKMPHLSRASSFSSMTDSTVSLNIITVTLNMDSVPFLGISIVGQSNGCQENGDGGIYVGSIMKGGAVSLDGRIEPGDMILEVNGISFENVSNEEAVRTLRDQVQRPGPVTLVVAKSWDPPVMTGANQPPPQGMLGGISQPPGTEGGPNPNLVRPIDPRAWVLHTMASTNTNTNNTPGENIAGSGMMLDPHTGNIIPFMGHHQPGIPHQMPPLSNHQNNNVPGAMSTVASTLTTTTSSSLKSSSVVEASNPNNMNMAGMAGMLGTNNSNIDTSDPNMLLTSSMDPSVIVRAMAQPDSGLLIRDRLWLKITIYNAFIGSDLVDWLYSRVHGFSERKDARKYASNLLKSGHIRHTVNKSTFSEQCYYVFNEITPAFSTLNLDSEIDSVSMVVGQQQAKARMMMQQQQHELSNSKDSPILSSGFQSGCSNKWSNHTPPTAQPIADGSQYNPVAVGANLFQNNMNFYHPNTISGAPDSNIPSQLPPGHKTLSHLSSSTPHGLSTTTNHNTNNTQTNTNKQPGNHCRNTAPGSVHSGSVATRHCVCLNSMNMLKAVKNLWSDNLNNSHKPIQSSTTVNQSSAQPTRQPSFSNTHGQPEVTEIASVTGGGDDDKTCGICGGNSSFFGDHLENDEYVLDEDSGHTPPNDDNDGSVNQPIDKDEFEINNNSHIILPPPPPPLHINQKHSTSSFIKGT